jgi:hypothetical protein
LNEDARRRVSVAVRASEHCCSRISLHCGQVVGVTFEVENRALFSRDTNKVEIEFGLCSGVDVENSSFDFAIVRRPEQCPELDEIVEEAAQEFGWGGRLEDLQLMGFNSEEFPPSPTIRNEKTRRRTENKARKCKRKAQRVARRRCRQ